MLQLLVAAKPTDKNMYQHNVIDVVVGCHVRKSVFLRRIHLCPSEDYMFSFKLQRKQFPIPLCSAMTINKAGGQTIPIMDLHTTVQDFSTTCLRMVEHKSCSSFVCLGRR